MDHVEEARRVLFTRVQSFDSENAFKIMGYLLLQDWGEQDLLRIALGPESVLYSIIVKAKKELGLVNNVSALQVGESFPQDVDELSLPHTRAVRSPSPASPFECKPPMNDSFLLAPSFRGFGMSHSNSYQEVNEQWPPLPLPPYMYDKTPPPISHGFHEKLHNPRQNHFYSYKDHENILHMQPKWVSTLPSAVDGNLPHYNSSSPKPCLFFSRGYCKHGNNCRFVHAHDTEKNIQGLSFLDDADSTGSDDSFLSAVSFERLEQELRELLKGRQVPVSIASLPQLYYERFGKSLQAEGYLTESQRHGKAGFSLTKLLMRLKGIVTLIERPHGQHAVMLTEDALLLNEVSRGYRDDYSNMNASSRQIYLTFPAESTFTEEDVTIHFRAYGPVQDVRIPYQQKRMFGFVTFVYSDTVRTILTEGNPHYICGARVLVKPYKEKGKVGDRKLQERDPFKHIPVNNHIPARRYQREEQQHMNSIVDTKVSALEQTLGDLQLNESGHTKSSAQDKKPAQCDATHRNDEALVPDLDPSGEGCLSTDDGFSLQSSNFKYVLDLLDGESKDTETTDNTIMIASRFDTQDVQFEGADIKGTGVNSMQTVKSYHLNSQNSRRLMQHSWGAPTLFARSVF